MLPGGFNEICAEKVHKFIHNATKDRQKFKVVDLTAPRKIGSIDSKFCICLFLPTKLTILISHILILSSWYFSMKNLSFLITIFKWVRYLLI